MRRMCIYIKSSAHAMEHLTRIQYHMARAGLQSKRTSCTSARPCKRGRTVPHRRRNQGGHCMDDCRDYGLHPACANAQTLRGKRLLGQTHLNTSSELYKRDRKCKRHRSDQSSSSWALRVFSQIERAA